MKNARPRERMGRRHKRKKTSGRAGADRKRRRRKQYTRAQIGGTRAGGRRPWTLHQHSVRFGLGHTMGDASVRAALALIRNKSTWSVLPLSRADDLLARCAVHRARAIPCHRGHDLLISDERSFVYRTHQGAGRPAIFSHLRFARCGYVYTGV